MQSQKLRSGDGRDPERKEPRPPRVLVVDDFDDTRLLFVESLRFAGFEVDEAANGPDAIAMATALSPDIVLMDLAMPGMDGWETTRRLKADPRTRSIRVLAVTAHQEAEHRLLAWRAGCDEFLSKPVLPQDLVDRIRSYMAA